MRAHVAACLVVTLAMLTFLLDAWAHDIKPIAITVSPTAVLAGGSFLLTCRVLRHPDNRTLIGGVANYRDSERQLDGDSARVTWPFLIEHVPCDSGPAYCAVRRNTGELLRVQQTYLIGGCDH